MSTDFKSADQKLKQILDKSKDVDPDLRFMALNDLNKLLVEHNLIINKVNSYSSKIIKILLDSLNDPNSDVQNQSLKCFKPLVSSLDDQEILEILRDLNAGQTTSASITTSIQTMAINEILKNLNLKHSSTGSLIVVELLPSLISNGSGLITSLDSIEILTDLINNLGSTIPSNELSKIYTALVKTIFGEVNIISKKSVVALGYLVNSLSVEEFENVIALIQNSHGDSYEDINLTLLTFNSLAKANHDLFIPYLQQVLDFSFHHLYLNNEDLDDDQIKIDEVRYEALQLIASLVSIGESFKPFISTILTIVQKFLTYDPYTNNYEEEEMDNDFSDEEEFSDDEDFDDMEEESDDNTWKLRKQAAKLCSLLVVQFPTILFQIYSEGIFETLINSVSDSSETVSFEKIHAMDSIIEVTIKQHGKRSNRKRRGSDVSMSDIDDSLTQMNKLRGKIVSRFIKELSNVKHNNLSKFNTLLQFFQRFNRLDEDLKPLLIAIGEHNFGLNLDLLKFYSSLLKNNDLEYFGGELNYIIETINSGLTSKNHISILNSIEASIDLLNLAYNETLTNSIIEIANTNKNDSEIRNTAIQSLGELKKLPPKKVNDLHELFVDTLKYEPIVVSTIKSITGLVEFYNDTIETEVINKIVKIYEKIVLDFNYSINVIESLGVIVRYFEIDSSIGDLLLKLFEEDKYQSQILRVVSNLKFDKSKLKSIFLKASTIDEIDDGAIIELGKRIGSELIPNLESDTSNIRNIKVLAEIVINENLIDYVRAREQDLVQNNNDLIFNIRLLGYVGEKITLAISIDQLLSHFADDETKVYAAEALGRMISKNSKEYLAGFLQKIQNDEYRYLLLISIKQVLKINNGLVYNDFNDIWNTIISILEREEDIDDDLAKISAQNLGLILVKNNDTNYFYNKASELIDSNSSSIVYTIIASIKFILAYDNLISIELIESILLQVFNKISDENLKIKQISVITLITVLNNQFNLLIPYLPTVLPIVYEELAMRKQYQETIQIGPFKHKVDKALEVRKNSFEILYKLSLNHHLLNNVDYNQVLSMVIKHGLSSDIISISSLIIIKLLEFDDVLLSVEDKQFLSNGIDKLLGNIKKKEDQQKDSKEEQETKSVLINLRKSIFD